MNYYKVDLKISPIYPWSEVITQSLADIDFESFTEEDDKLQAFISEENYDEEKLNQLLDSYRENEVEISYESTFIPNQNWNAAWESDYQPVEIDNVLLIRAPFHKEDSRFPLSLEIQPQMSFGTGHHQTTYLLCKAIMEMDLNQKKVLDVGTGTGILGILAAKRGANYIFGTDIEEDAVLNAIENCERNAVTNFDIVKGDIEVVTKNEFDVIFANINMNVLLRHISSYASLIKDNGQLLLSGFFEIDVDTLTQEAEKHGFTVDEVFKKEGWAVIKLFKQEK